MRWRLAIRNREIGELETLTHARMITRKIMKIGSPRGRAANVGMRIKMRIIMMKMTMHDPNPAIRETNAGRKGIQTMGIDIYLLA